MSKTLMTILHMSHIPLLYVYKSTLFSCHVQGLSFCFLLTPHYNVHVPQIGQ